MYRMVVVATVAVMVVVVKEAAQERVHRLPGVCSPSAYYNLSARESTRKAS